MTQHTESHQDVTLVSHHPRFEEIIGKDFSFVLLAESDLPIFHEACIYHSPTHSIFITSSQLSTGSTHTATANKYIKLSRVYVGPSDEVRVRDVSFAGIADAMLNGGVNYDDQRILLCVQGNLAEVPTPSGLLSLAVESNDPDEEPRWHISDFYGIPFNSLNDVVIHPKDRSIWFTDPCYGYHQGFRAPPQLPNQVYRYDPSDGSCRVVADGFSRPNGLCFSPDLQTMYITDTGAIHGSDSIPLDPAGPSHIYAFDVVSRSESSQPFLTNRRTFAYAPGKIPDGIKCDTNGNIYSGCGDGIEVWNSGGVLLGMIKIDGGVSNFCFGEGGVVYACNETRLWRIQLNASRVRGALLGI